MHRNGLKCVGMGWSGSGPKKVIIDWNEFVWDRMRWNGLEGLE